MSGAQASLELGAAGPRGGASARSVLPALDVSSLDCGGAGDRAADFFAGEARPARKAAAILRVVCNSHAAPLTGNPVADALALLRQEPPGLFDAAIALLAAGYPDYALCIIEDARVPE